MKKSRLHRAVFEVGVKTLALPDEANNYDTDDAASANLSDFLMIEDRLRFAAGC